MATPFAKDARRRQDCRVVEGAQQRHCGVVDGKVKHHATAGGAVTQRSQNGGCAIDPCPDLEHRGCGNLRSLAWVPRYGHDTAECLHAPFVGDRRAVGGRGFVTPESGKYGRQRRVRRVRWRDVDRLDHDIGRLDQRIPLCRQCAAIGCSNDHLLALERDGVLVPGWRIRLRATGAVLQTDDGGAAIRE